MVYDTIKAAAAFLKSPFRARPSFIVHGTRPARYGDDKLYPPPTPPGTPTSMEAKPNQSFSDDWKMPRGLVWKTYWQRTKADIKYYTRTFRENNLGLVLIFFAQFFASIMSMTTRLLETSFETKIHALQIIFVRMFTTSLIGCAYLAYMKTPGFPFGPREVRGLLILRSLFGTIGLFGLYYSLGFLDIADATVITFLVPSITSLVCWIALNEPLTFQEAGAGLTAFVGVLFIARPPFLFPVKEDNFDDIFNAYTMDSPAHTFSLEGGGLRPPIPPTPAERGVAIVCAIIGSFAAASAYATIRVIGKRTHALVSVNYFAIVATITSFLIILVHPGLQFEVPLGGLQWCLLMSIGLSGFLLQVLLTLGLQMEKAGRATNLIYFQMVFALVIERVVWGTTPPWTSFLGSFFIIGAALWVSIQSKVSARHKPQDPEADAERRPLLENRD